MENSAHRIAILGGTVTLRIELDDKLSRISLVMIVDQQKQFRLGKLGLDPGLDARLRSLKSLGEIYDPEVPLHFYQQNQLLFFDGDPSFRDAYIRNAVSEATSRETACRKVTSSPGSLKNLTRWIGRSAPLTVAAQSSCFAVLVAQRFEQIPQSENGFTSTLSCGRR
jgi:hypothetical protein